ncbi:T9SS type A sorting domain-containing protein [Taibaiella soli]|uniref:Secretion system C-terminal sorting domain-containing protein n=1 Tax=Taibaiella soli TaxID=1649169 RepID=A0A2W2BDZ0_9BACT|nr:T9SS type A sorting domain-containing protein [Taibaiella soli]PZF74479.1 hypothetical protein DN068_02555 [Taibaiella soli]
MKRLLPLLLLLIFSCSIAARATHLMGGDLIVTHNSGNNYTVTITLYRDTTGIPLTSVDFLYVDSLSATTNQFVGVLQTTVNRNWTLGTALIPSFPYGIEVGVYTYDVNLVPGNTYRFVYSNCCRNGAIQNATAPLNENMVLYTDFQAPAAANNSSPDFLAMPVAYFPVNTPITYNPLPYDPDADSIAWGLNTPIGAYQAPTAMVSVAGFTTPPGATTGPFTMNPVTGEISWQPNTLGNFIQSFEVKEYRNGVQIGTIIRDMQYVVIPGGGATPSFSMVSPYMTNSGDGYYYVYYDPGQQLNFSISGQEASSTANLQMQAYGGVFQMAVPAMFGVTGSGNNITGNFTWTPPVTYTKDETIVFRLRDGMFSQDFTLVMRKNPSPASVGNVTAAMNSVRIFPNPAHDQVTVMLDLKNDIQGNICLYNALGQKARTIYDGKLVKGKYQLRDDFNLPAGMYQLVVRDNGQVLKTERLLVQ